MENNKQFIPPKYDTIGGRSYDNLDDDDDDDLDDDDDDLDDIYDEEDGKTQELENYLDNKDREETNKSKTMQSTQTTPFGQSVNNSPWSSTPNFGTGSWGVPNNPWQQKSWGNIGTSAWGNTGGSSWGTGSSWNNNSGNSWGSWNNVKKESIDRTKKIIFCDFLDCLIETYQSNGKPGLLPRGVYDVRLRFEVWDKLKCFGAEKIYAVTPKMNIITNNGIDSWTVLMNYVTCSLSEYLRVQYNNCQILTQSHISQSKMDLIKYAIDKSKINKSDALMIGLNSGLVGQSDSDRLVAEHCGIDYVDLGQLMSMYF